MKKPTETKWHCCYNPGRQGYDFFFMVQFGNSDPWHMAQNIEFIVRKDFGDYPNAFFTLEQNQAQQLMDALWTAGLRPTEGHSSVGQIGAVERHLEDMRKLVFESFVPSVSGHITYFTPTPTLQGSS